MIFKIKVLKNSIVEYWTYDNIKNVFRTPDGINPFEEYRQTFDDGDIFDGESNNFKLSREDIDHLYITLGTKCNFKCKYCHQRDVESLVVEASPKLVPRFLEMLDAANLKLKFISFWGGEPLVYWKTIKLLLPELRKRYPHPDTRLSIQSNGSLFTEEMADEMLKVHCNLSVSYDGKTSARDRSILDDPKIVKALKYFGIPRDYRNLNIMPTQSEYTNLTSDISKTVAEILHPNVDVARMSIVRSNSDQFSGSIAISPQKREMFERDFYYHLQNETNPLMMQVFESKIQRIFAGASAYSNEFVFCPISIGKGVTLDLAGNVLTCMNVPKSILGHIEDLSSCKRSDIYHPLTKQACRQCPYLCMCYGGCPLVKRDDTVQFHDTCDNLKCIARPRFKVVMERVFGVYPLQIEYPNNIVEKFL